MVGSAPEKRPPGVVRWLNIYAIGLSAYVLVSLFLVVTFSEELPVSAPEQTRLMNSLFVMLSIALSVGFGAMPFLPRRTWTWIYGLVLIAIGFLLGLPAFFTRQLHKQTVL